MTETSDLDPWWKKHITFKWTDEVVEEVMQPGWDDGLSIGEIKELARDFLILKKKFRNMIAWADIGEEISYYYLDKINNCSDEELLEWRKKRNDKIAADRKMIREMFDK